MARKEFSITAEEVAFLIARLSPVKGPVGYLNASRILGCGVTLLVEWVGEISSPTVYFQKKIRGLIKALDALEGMIDFLHIIKFFEQKHPLLGGTRPKDLLGTDREEEIMDLIRGASSGAFT